MRVNRKAPSSSNVVTHFLDASRNNKHTLKLRRSMVQPVLQESGDPAAAAEGPGVGAAHCVTKPDSHLAVPLGPARLFIVTNNAQTTAYFQAMRPRDLVMRMNKRVVRNAIKYVWDTDLANERLIKGQLSADADSDPLFFKGRAGQTAGT